MTESESMLEDIQQCKLHTELLFAKRFNFSTDDTLQIAKFMELLNEKMCSIKQSSPLIPMQASSCFLEEDNNSVDSENISLEDEEGPTLNFPFRDQTKTIKLMPAA